MVNRRFKEQVNRVMFEHRASKWVFSLFLLAAAGCKKDPTPTPVPDKPPIAVTSSEPAPSVSAKEAIPLRENNEPKEIPTWVPEKVTFKDHKIERAFLMDDGNFAVVEGLKVGRVVDDNVEWLEKQVPETNTSLGGSHITWVGGYWPDAVDVTYQSNNGRASQPTFYPLTGKGNTIVYGEGGGVGDIVGVARLGESTLIGGADHLWTKFATVRGPGVIRGRKLFAEAGCKYDESIHRIIDEKTPAIEPSALGATGAGTVITVGNKCGKGNPSLEVWEKDQRLSKIVSLDPDVKEVDYWAQVLAGQADDAWIRVNESSLFHYKEGQLEKLPTVENGIQHIFISPNRQLYGANSWGVHRWDKDHWTQIARFAWEENYPRFFADKSEHIWANYGPQKLTPGSSVEMHAACATPFIHLYNTSSDNKPDFTFPTTRKALASFSEVNDLTLMEFYEGRRRLGLAVKSKAQGEAVIAHLKTTMPKEKPRLMCYEPKKPRKIDIQPKSK
jgi:hypothetical protein